VYERSDGSMRLLEMLLKAQGGGIAGTLAKSFGIPPSAAEAAMKAVIPRLGEGIERNTLSKGGLADLINALGQGHHEQALRNPNVFTDPAARDDGNAILGHLLGNKDKSRALAAAAARESGLDESVIKAMLPGLASVLMGGLSSQTRQSFGDILGRLPQMPGGGQMGGGRGGGFPMPWPAQQDQSGGGQMGSGNSMPWPDQSNQRNPMPWPQEERGGSGQWGGGQSGGGMGGSMPGQSPLPLPGNVPNMPSGGNNPYGDLSDILRKGGGIQIPIPIPGGGQGGGILANVIRGILGSLLGFNGGGGVMSWLIRMFVMKFGWGLLRSILGRVLTGGR
jgi:hypothetical protein